MTERLARAVLEITTDNRGMIAGLDDAIQRAGGLQSAFGKVGKDLQKFGRETSDLGRTLSLGLTAPILGAGVAVGKAAMDFDSSLAGVRKTVDATEPEIQALGRGFRDMAREIPVSVNELNRIGEAAGQLGIKKENILGFSRVMADLGVTTNLSAEEAATALARLANITGMPQTEFDRLGSTVVALGNSLATTESEIVEMALRLAGAGRQVGLTEAEVLALSGTLSSVGIAAEAGGSAFTKVMIRMQDAVMSGGRELELFSRVAGQDFKKAFEQDAAQAINLFVAGLGRMSENGENLTPVLKELELGEIRVSDALRRTGNAYELMAGAVDGARQAWQENTALTKEAQQRYETFESKLQLLGNQLYDIRVEVGTALLPTFQSMIDVGRSLAVRVSEIAEWFGQLPQPIRTATVSIGLLAAGIGPLLFVAGQMITAVGAITSALGAGGALSLLGSIGRVVVGLTGPAGLVVGVGLALAKFEPFRNLLGSLVRALIAVGREGVGFVAEKFRELLRWIQPVTDRIGALVSWAGEKLGGAMNWAAEGLDDFTSGLGDARSGVELLGGGIQHLAPELPKISTSFSTTGQHAYDLGEALRQMTFETTEFASAAAALERAAPLVQPLTDLERLVMEAQRRMPDLIPADEIVGDAERVQDALTGPKSILQSIGDLVSAAGSFLSGLFSKVSDWAVQLGGKIDTAFGNMFSKLGLDLGNLFGGAIGAGLASAAGFILGKLGELFSGIFSHATAAQHAAEQFGFQLSQSLSDQIDQIAKAFGGDLDAAIRTSLDDIIAELGVTAGNFDTFVTKIHQIFSSVDEGAFTVTEAIGHIGDALQQLIPQMAAAGGSAMDLQSLFSDMISRARAEGQDLGVVVVPTIQAAIDAMLASGVEGVDELVGWLRTLGIELEGIGSQASRGATKAAEAWDWWQEQTGNSYQAAERHNRAFFESIATQMGLTGDVFDAWVEGMLKKQRESERERIKSNREMWRQQAIDAGLTGDQITEYVNAQIRLQRQAERNARREERQERRQNVVDQVEDGKLVRDRLMQFIDQIGARWSSMYEQASADASSFASSVNFSAPTGSGGSPTGSFADGTGFQFLDFGASSLAYLHGEEAVINRDQADSLVGMLRGSVAAGLAGAMEHARSTSGGGDDRALAAQRESNRELRDQISGLRRDLLTSFVTIAERAGRHGALTAGRR